MLFEVTEVVAISSAIVALGPMAVVNQAVAVTPGVMTPKTSAVTETFSYWVVSVHDAANTLFPKPEFAGPETATIVSAYAALVSARQNAKDKPARKKFPTASTFQAGIGSQG